MLQCAGCKRIYQIPSSQTQSAYDALLCLQNREAVVQYCLTSFKVVQYCSFTPSLRCKGTTKFADVQEKLHFSAIFLV